MLVHKEFVEKVYQYQNLVKAIEATELEIKEYIVKDATLTKEENEKVWDEIHRTLKEGALSDDLELVIAQLDLLLAQIRVQTLSSKPRSHSDNNKVILFEESKTN
ncbi:hypothetical protein [Bacillus testis]|uniref:hypothetical protein n=1 Tax=Bacillus testis TaxID=1622072 RepID=UPI00067EC23D|nr:hypothetical protein [Bacillus testis]